MREKVFCENIRIMFTDGGFECVNQPTEVTLFQMMESPDWIQFTLDLPMAKEP